MKRNLFVCLGVLLTLPAFAAVEDGDDQRIASVAYVKGAHAALESAISGLPTQDTNTTYAAGTGIEITGANNAIGIKSSGVTATQLATSAVTTDKINAGAVTSAKLATSAVLSAAISAGAVTSAKLATSAVVAAAISANAVTNAKIANNAVTLAKIDSTAKQNATNSAYTSLTKLTTQGYVNEQIAGLADAYQEKLKTETGDEEIGLAVIDDINNTSADPGKSLATMGAIKDRIDESTAGLQTQLKNATNSAVNIDWAVKTAISASSANASDSHLVTEKAIATALAGKQATLTSTNVTTSGTTAGAGAVVTGVSASNGTVTVRRANVQIPVGSSSATNSYASIWIQ